LERWVVVAAWSLVLSVLPFAVYQRDTKRI